MLLVPIYEVLFESFLSVSCVVWVLKSPLRSVGGALRNDGEHDESKRRSSHRVFDYAMCISLCFFHYTQILKIYLFISWLDPCIKPPLCINERIFGLFLYSHVRLFVMEVYWRDESMKSAPINRDEHQAL